MTKWIKDNWVLIAIILVAIFFRFWKIDSLPAGLFPDEAAYGMDGRSITNGVIQPFFERGNGREGLFMYFLALAITLFGYIPWANHIVTASFGLGTVLVTYFLTKQIFDKKTAQLAAFFIAVSSYAVTVTRTGFRANTAPFFGALTLLFVVKAFNDDTPKKRLISSCLAGLFFGLGFYTYITFRMMLPLLAGFFLILILGNRSFLKLKWQEYRGRIFGFALAFIIAFSWIGYYWFVQHPGTFVGRAGQVSIFSDELNNGDVVGTFTNVFNKTIKSYFTDGDLNWRHNVSGFPHLSPLISPFFGVTTIVFTLMLFTLLKQMWQQKIQKATVYRVLLAGWFWVMLVPEVTTAEGIPHALRLIGTIPVIFILAARGIVWLWNKVCNTVYVNKLKFAYAAIFLVTLFIYNFYLYFVIAAESPEYHYSFRSDLTEVSRYINEVNNHDRTFLALDAFSVQTVDYLTTPTNQPYYLVLPEKAENIEMLKGYQMIFTQSTLPDAERFARAHPETKLIKEVKNRFGQTIMLVYQRQ